MKRSGYLWVLPVLVCALPQAAAQETPGRLDVLTPDEEAGTYLAGVAEEYHAAIPPEDGYGPFTLALPVSILHPNGPQADPDQGCDDYENADEVAHRIALVRDGGCEILTKYFEARQWGARGLVIYGEDADDDSTFVTNYAWGSDVYMGFYGVYLTGHRGARLRAAVEAGAEVLVTMRTEPTVTAEAEPDRSPLMVHVWPNPARGATTVTVTLPCTDEVTVTVHDALGRRILTLHEGSLPAREHAFRLNAGGLAGGTYFVRVSARASSVTRPLVVLR